MTKKVFAIKLGSYIFIKPYPNFENEISGFHDWNSSHYVLSL